MAAHRQFYGVDIDAAGEPTAAATADVVAVFQLLKPKASTTPLIRIGGDADGAYLVPDDLAGIAACFSPGVNRIKYFEDVLTDRFGIASHMCDFSCDADQLTTPLRPGMQTFVKKWLDVSPGEDNISLDDWVRDHDVPGDLLLQMDIEGAEYRNILAASEETLARFRVIVLEVHGLGKMLDASILGEVIAPFFRKLARSFTTVHAHPNNCCGDFLVPGTDIRIPNVLELTFVRTDRFVPAPGPVLLPHPLDVRRNVPRNAPLFLSDAWCDHQRPLESRVTMLEDTLRYRDEVVAASADAELGAALALTMQSLQSLDRRATPPPATSRDLVEVAAGRPYRLSSAYGSSSRTGLVQPGDGYFFHTGFEVGPSIRVDLGRTYPVRRIEVTNRRGGHQERARLLFAVLAAHGSGTGEPHVVPLVAGGQLPGGAWQECSTDLPDVPARYVTITSPITTALHFADLKIYAARPAPAPPGRTQAPRRLLRRVRRRLTAATARARRPAGRG